jgi:hypothetical protein
VSFQFLTGVPSIVYAACPEKSDAGRLFVSPAAANLGLAFSRSTTAS